MALTHKRENSVTNRLRTTRGLSAVLTTTAIALLAGVPAAAESSDAPVVEQLLDLLRDQGDISDEQHSELLDKENQDIWSNE